MITPENMLRVRLELNLRADDTKSARQNKTGNVDVSPIGQLVSECSDTGTLNVLHRLS